MILRWCCILILVYGKVSTEPTDVIISENLSYIDVLRQSLARQSWTNDDSACLEALMMTLNEAQNSTLWAVWALDSIEPPNGLLYAQSYVLGNYEQCLFPSRGFEISEDIPTYKYCMIDLKLTSVVDDEPFSRDPKASVDVYLKKKTSLKQILSRADWGLCVPSVCSPQSVTKVARAVLQTSYFRDMDHSSSLQVKYCEVGSETTPKQYPMGYYFFTFIVLLLIITAVWCTYHLSVHKPRPNTFGTELARSFCLKRNYDELIKPKDDEIYAMNFMRIFNLTLIIFGHQGFYMIFRAVNSLGTEYIIKDVAYTMHLDLLTDTFFTLSGLLFLRGLFNDKHKSIRKYMWKRYVRLMTAVAILIAFTIFVFEHIDQGPIWRNFVVPEVQMCKNNWLRSFFMIQNIFNIENMCIYLTWYVPADFQLSVLVAILFFIYQKNKKAATTAFWILLSFGFIQPGLATYFQEYYALPLNDFELSTTGYPRIERSFTEHYIQPTAHLAPFLLGALMGYIMFTYKPKDHRKCISQRWSYIAMAVALTLMGACLALGGFYFLAPHETRVSLHGAVFSGVNRGLWSVGICLILAVCEYGDIPVLQRSAAWFPLVPLSRLSYETYLMQYPTMLALLESSRSPVTSHMYHNIILTIGITVMSYACGLFLWLFMEAPIININNMLLNKTWKKLESEEKVVNNNHNKKLENHIKKL